MVQLRAAVRKLIRTRGGIQAAATDAECGRATLYRILQGKPVSFDTAVRIVNNLGGHIEIRVTETNSQS